MPYRKLKPAYFLLEWLNSYSVTFYLFFLFFLLREEYGFNNLKNLFFSAAGGLIYLFASWLAGRVAQKRGYFYALRVGFSGMAVMLMAGGLLHGVAAQFVVMLVYMAALSFTWPALEALVSEHETRPGLSRMIGIYNVMWSSGAAVAYFTGGALLEHFGRAILFWGPAAIHVIQWLILARVTRQAGELGYTGLHPVEEADEPDTLSTTEEAEAAHLPPVVAKSFLRMAWLANPFAYVAMNTLIPLLPDLAARLQLSTTMAGVVGSVWMFARMIIFYVLWRWTQWHYRYSWMVGAYLAMLVTFVTILVVPSLWVVLAAEVLFGFAVGLIYYSSLFYSMDVGETKGEHGGLHEAMIGVGIFLGPAVGATTLRFLPGVPQAGVWAVTALLGAGFAGLAVLRPKATKSPAYRNDLASASAPPKG